MHLEIIKPDKKIFEGDVSLVQFPGFDGSFEVLHNHAPLISVLKKGQIKVQGNDKQNQFFEIKGGIVEVLHDKIVVLAE